MKVIIMMGLPGSGKSTLANAIQGSKLIVSSDNYFTDADGNYHWSIEEANKGHEDCLRRFMHVFKPGPAGGDPKKQPDTVIVDNTNVRIHDISPYIRIAQAYGCDVEVKYMDTDIDIAKSRNVHNVPEAAYDRMQKNFAFLIETWPKDFPPIQFIYGSVDEGSPSFIYNQAASPAYGCLLSYEDKTEFDVVLKEFGMNKLRVIRWVRENTKLSLADSKELVENVPKNVLSFISKLDADLAKQELESIGAKVEIR